MHLHVASIPYTARRCSPEEARSRKGLPVLALVVVLVVALVVVLVVVAGRVEWEEEEDDGAQRACRAMA
jgi:Tfp pilus assembly protein PilN